MSETHIGRAMRWYMIEQGISTRDLSKRIGVPHSTLQRFLREGASLSTQNFLRLMTWFNSPIDPPITRDLGRSPEERVLTKKPR